MGDLKTINEAFTNKEYLELKKAKKDSTWHDFILQGTVIKARNINYKLMLDIVRKQFLVMCDSCSKMKALHIHHKDKNQKNNILSNLSLLCRKCHGNIHRLEESK